MAQYKGTITTTGASEAIRLDKHLFKSHPEFQQKAKVVAQVVGRGVILISLVEEPSLEDEEDPLVGAFLAFLENDIMMNPARVTPLTEEDVASIDSIVSGVSVSDDEVLPEETL
jgi:antitoxin PrlF